MYAEFTCFSGFFFLFFASSIINVHFRYMQVRLSYRFENCQAARAGSKCDIFLGVEWIKSTKFRKRITKEVCQKLTERSREILELVAKEFL